MHEFFVSGSDGSVRARWLAFEGLIDLRCEETAIRAIEKVLQIELPRQANRYLGDGERSACWMAPLHWLLRLPEHEESALVAKLAKFSNEAGPCEDKLEGDGTFEGDDKAESVRRVDGVDTGADQSCGHAAITVVSDAYIGIRLEGLAATRVLSAGCPLDFSRLGPGCCARTLLARAQVMVIVLEQGSGYELLVERSHSDYVQQWITAAVSASTTDAARGSV